ncbi:hypothetical protein GCM10010411_75200 [Actinomadura fulvescens]|uniref:DUF4145 domain-containing protein n=1 Tax=Actinomadura fulvescens TaxID=46160 RepID=A0ABN3QIM6_9ACTN
MTQAMWNYDRFVSKARLYFQRAEDHPAADEAATLWLLLGLEFLMRAPLARVHPTLLAETSRNDSASLMHAAGFSSGSPNDKIKSIGITTVCARLLQVVDGFAEVRNDAAHLINLRNSELHTADEPLGVAAELWLPRFVRVVETICRHLGEEPTNLVGPELMGHGRGLVQEQNERLRHEVLQRIKEAAEGYAASSTEQGGLSVASSASPSGGLFGTFAVWELIDPDEPIRHEDTSCPACGSQADLVLQRVRATSERIIDGQLHRVVVYLATGLSCPTCTLKLTGTPEIAAAGLDQQHIRTVQESLEERYLGNLEPDYDYDDYR